MIHYSVVTGTVVFQHEYMHSCLDFLCSFLPMWPNKKVSIMNYTLLPYSYKMACKMIFTSYFYSMLTLCDLAQQIKWCPATRTWKRLFWKSLGGTTALYCLHQS